jgi:glycosyltransferase involved in cell wall biosynthesis
MSNYILWIGSVYDEEHLKENNATSPAGNYWQSSLLKAFVLNDEKIVILSSHFQRIFPFGSLFPNGSRYWMKGFRIISTMYINLPFLKTLTLFFNQKIKFSRYSKKFGFPKYIISYNASIENSKIAAYLKDRYNIPWIDLCADAYDPGVNWENYPEFAKLANGHVFLSDFAFRSCPFKNTYHFDGGIETGKINFNFKSNSPIKILYSGMLGIYGGLDLLIESFIEIDNSDLNLIICGHGKKSAVLKRALLMDSRIKFHGLLSESELKDLYESVDIFVNPRPDNIDGSSMNFPSKILKYLAYGKPIISTITPGLSPIYSEFLFYFDSSDVTSFEKTLSRIISWDYSLRIAYSKKIDHFIGSNKNWLNQSKQFLVWLNSFDKN